MNYPKNKNDNFFDRVFEVVKLIPVGRVTSYGAIAKSIGSPQSSRMVGWALNNSSLNEDAIPAHRVVNRIGLLTGKNQFRTPTLMQELLESEGVKIKNDKVVDFEKHFWDPMKEIEIE